MGSLTIKAKILRCEKCFMLKKFLIEPNFPESTIVSECSCGFSRIKIISFIEELKKKKYIQLNVIFVKTKLNNLYIVLNAEEYIVIHVKLNTKKIKKKKKNIFIQMHINTIFIVLITRNNYLLLIVWIVILMHVLIA